MSGNLLNRVFLARLAGTAVFDPNGDPVGKVRDGDFVRSELADLVEELAKELRRDTQSDSK
jgi:hypothetical protein